MTTITKQVERKLRGSGGRMTSQRRLILQTLENAAGHPSAEEIYTLARQQDPTLNLSTVYRNLRWLEEMELVSPRRFEDDPRLNRFDPGSPLEHHHFRCYRCGAIIEFSSKEIDTVRAAFEAENDARVEETTLILYGTCSRCKNGLP
jgi:Fur family transcriptional regulator, ferric uptake regulator